MRVRLSSTFLATKLSFLFFALNNFSHCWTFDEAEISTRQYFLRFFFQSNLDTWNGSRLSSSIRCHHCFRHHRHFYSSSYALKCRQWFWFYLTVRSFDFILIQTDPSFTTWPSTTICMKFLARFYLTALSLSFFSFGVDPRS